MKVKIYNPHATANRIVNNAQVGKFVAETWVRYFAKYTPMQQGILRSNVVTKPFQVIYMSPYAHYQWEGELYLTENGSSFARENEPKYPTGKPLNYSHEQNPNATSHWEVPAHKAFRNTVARQVTEYIRRM